MAMRISSIIFLVLLLTFDVSEAGLDWMHPQNLILPAATALMFCPNCVSGKRRRMVEGPLEILSAICPFSTYDDATCEENNGRWNVQEIDFRGSSDCEVVDSNVEKMVEKLCCIVSEKSQEAIYHAAFDVAYICAKHEEDFIDGRGEELVESCNNGDLEQFLKFCPKETTGSFDGHVEAHNLLANRLKMNENVNVFTEEEIAKMSCETQNLDFDSGSTLTVYISKPDWFRHMGALLKISDTEEYFFSWRSAAPPSEFNLYLGTEGKASLYTGEIIEKAIRFYDVDSAAIINEWNNVKSHKTWNIFHRSCSAAMWGLIIAGMSGSNKYECENILQNPFLGYPETIWEMVKQIGNEDYSHSLNPEEIELFEYHLEQHHKETQLGEYSLGTTANSNSLKLTTGTMVMSSVILLQSGYIFLKQCMASKFVEENNMLLGNDVYML